MATINTTNFGKKETVRIYCTNSDKTVDAELVKMDKDRMIVILPGFQKLILNKVAGKPHFYMANMFGMEFTCNTQDK